MKKSTAFFTGLVTAAGLSFLSVQAQAAITTYSSTSTFDAASTGLTTYTFPVAIPTGDLPYQQVSSPYTFGPLTFSDPTTNGNSSGALYLQNDGNYGAGQTYLGAFPAPTETITTSGETAIGLNLNTFNASQTLAVDVNGAFLTDITTAAPGSYIFLGLVSSSAINTITLTDLTDTSTGTGYGEGEETDIVNFTVGSAAGSEPSGVPAPGALALFGFGLAALGATRKRTS